MRVFFTFDDGPHRWTPAILDVLKEHEAKATFFVLGCYALAADEVVQRAASEGHAIGVHGWDHVPWPRKAPAELARDIEATANLILELTGAYPKLYRPPHHSAGAQEDSVARYFGLTRVPADCDPGDWMHGKTAEGLARYVRTHAREHALVNFHDGIPPGGGAGCAHRSATVKAVALLLHGGMTSTTVKV